MPKCLTTRKTKKQQGGAHGSAEARHSTRHSVSASANTYTSKDINDFFESLRHTKFEFDQGHLYSKLPRFFIEDNSRDGRRGKIIIDPKWHKMINEATYTSKGYTPLYYALRYEADLMIIDMLLEVIKDINRPNSGGDNSTPLIGVCYGENNDARVNYNYITNAIKKFVERKAILDLKNRNGETMFNWLNYKSINGLIDL